VRHRIDRDRAGDLAVRPAADPVRDHEQPALRIAGEREPVVRREARLLEQHRALQLRDQELILVVLPPLAAVGQSEDFGARSPIGRELRGIDQAPA
jgi:hypothetical protein